jgi:hypothetical protein
VELFCLDGVPVLIEPGGKKKMDLCPTLALTVLKYLRREPTH